MSNFDPSARAVLEDLRAQYPDTPFLALGQTVWWDEPVKAVLRKMLDELQLGGRMVLGVHDTDYFAKAQVRQAGQSRFELMAHNDGSTKDLWSAAGEISRLFGSETFPTRSDFNKYHIPFNKVARQMGKDRLEFLNEATEAWGWRGLIYTGSRDLIVHRLPLEDMGDSVEEMLSWGFEGTRETIVDNCCREEAGALSARLLQWVQEYREKNPGKNLTDLYQDVFPRLFNLLLGAPPQDTDVECTAHLLLLNPETASLPRFEFVDLFLNEKTRVLAASAYNEAVAGSNIYTLDRFGLGALPFDLVLPKQGRGTLRVTLRAIHVETREPIRIPLKKPINSIQELAEILTAEFGDHVTLVGKAVALISMLAREFIFVFNEEGSGYVTRTRKLNDTLQANGVPLVMHPILRLKYRTWDTLEVAQSTLSLPDHLAATFGQRQIPAADFAHNWRKVVEEQDALLKTLEAIRKPRELMAFLAERGGDWTEQLAAYDEAKKALCTLREHGAAIQALVDTLYEELAATKAQIVATEHDKCLHFHSVTEWTSEAESRRSGFDARIQELLGIRKETLARIHDLKVQRLHLERGEQAVKLREQVVSIEVNAEAARLRLVSNAILTCTGLVHTDHRPSAWWLPMVDPCGHWFQRIAETTEVYTQPVLSA